LKLDLINNVNIMDLLNHKYLVIENPKASLEVLASRVKSSVSTEKEETVEKTEKAPAKKEESVKADK
jgi:hypothetical protein